MGRWNSKNVLFFSPRLIRSHFTLYCIFLNRFKWWINFDILARIAVKLLIVYLFGWEGGLIRVSVTIGINQISGIGTHCLFLLNLPVCYWRMLLFAWAMWKKKNVFVLKILSFTVENTWPGTVDKCVTIIKSVCVCSVLYINW